MPHYIFEARWLKTIPGPIAGVDEAGRGPLAGPVVAAAVILDKKRIPKSLDDSKRMTAEAREDAYARIMEAAIVGVGEASVDEIDLVNIRQAAWRAMHLALEQLDPKAQHVLVDGLRIKWLTYPQTALVQGDARSYSIAAASVLAKVTRDRMMREFEKQFPGYGFAEHKGYGTPRHLAAIRQLGPCPIHRRTFAPFRPIAKETDLFAP